MVAFCDEDELGAGDLFCRVSRVLDRDDSVVGAVGDEGGGGHGGERERREAGEGGFVVSPARPAILPRSDGSPLFLNALGSGWVGCDPVDRRPLLFFFPYFSCRGCIFLGVFFFRDCVFFCRLVGISRFHLVLCGSNCVLF